MKPLTRALSLFALAISFAACGEDLEKMGEGAKDKELQQKEQDQTQEQSKASKVESSSLFYFASINGAYRAVILAGIDDNGVTITSLDSAKIVETNTNTHTNWEIGTFGDISYAELTQDRLNSLVDVYETDLGLDVNEQLLQEKMSTYRQMIIRKDPLEAGEYQLTLTLGLSNGESVEYTQEFSVVERLTR